MALKRAVVIEDLCPADLEDPHPAVANVRQAAVSARDNPRDRSPIRRPQQVGARRPNNNAVPAANISCRSEII